MNPKTELIDGNHPVQLRSRRRHPNADARPCIERLQTFAEPRRLRIDVDEEGWPFIAGTYGRIECNDPQGPRSAQGSNARDCVRSMSRRRNRCDHLTTDQLHVTRTQRCERSSKAGHQAVTIAKPWRLALTRPDGRGLDRFAGAERRPEFRDQCPAPPAGRARAART